MTLTEYNEKRQFDQTPEPAGTGGSSGEGSLRFVVQKHRASRLHYDFRLEVDGVLKSWAIPKGPSLDPSQRRLAMMVEDHPYDYREFEGVIPEGNYGAGAVVLWDEGTYHALGIEDRAEGEAALRKGLEKGDLKFVLEGQKLQGEFALVKMRKGNEENNWLLLKKKDGHATDEDVLEQDRSVRTGKSLEEIAGQA
jgi:bifunctional non-homologous end joining protein LigD